MTNNYTRDEVIDLTLKQVDAWRKTPKEELCDSPDHSVNGVPYPSTKVEKDVSVLFQIYLKQGWIDSSDTLLDEIDKSLSVLDTGLNRPKQWEYLFQVTDELRKSIAKRCALKWDVNSAH